MGKKKSDPLAKESKLVNKFKEHWERAQSDLVDVRQSPIHGSGVYAAKYIPNEAQIIEYVGEYINKEESETRSWDQFAKHEESNDAAVYIFNLNEKWDLDGNLPWNNARLINHSCEPNCEALTEGEQIFIYALRDIEKGEELFFDYGFDLESYEDHPCLCGTESCVGYIVAQDFWPQLKVKLSEDDDEKEEVILKLEASNDLRGIS